MPSKYGHHELAICIRGGVACILSRMRLICALLLLFCATVKAADVPAWRMVWSDEFSQPDGAGPAGANWTFESGGGGWGNDELEYYTARRTNSSVENHSSRFLPKPLPISAAQKPQ